MTMTETKSSIPEGQNGHNGDLPALSDQFVMSTAGVASQGLSTLRQLAAATLATVDRAVTGTLDIADQFVRSNLISDLTSKTLAITRDTWTAGVTATRDLLIQV